jgi:hypothetical protein
MEFESGFCQLSATGRDAGHGVERSAFGRRNTRNRVFHQSPLDHFYNLDFNHFHQNTGAKMPEGESKQDKQATQAQARQVIDVFHEISTLLVRTTSCSTDAQADS